MSDLATLPLSSPIGFAHRGARAHAPENTLEAFALALEMGARGLESDVWITADGVAVLDHDGLIDGSLISRIPRAELPPHIPELAELYRECGSDYELSLDVKDAAAAPEVLRVADAAGATARMWLCHWNWRELLPWREASRDVKLVDSTRRQWMSTSIEVRARRMRKFGIDTLNLHHSDWSDDWVEVLHEQGRLAFAWDLQEETLLVERLEIGVDAVYSDHVDRMQRVLAGHERD